MATRNTKYPVEKPYLKVDRSWNSSSSGKVDLSYSYSCVKAFERNQHIIGELAATHNKAKYKGLSHEQTLFNLSGDREKPICQPFYYSTLSDKSEVHCTIKTSSKDTRRDAHSTYEPEFNRQLYKVNRSYRGNFVQDFHSEYEPEPPDLHVLIQWLKYRFKYINNFVWNTNFITNLCKRNRKIKMEMLLNNIDEGTKSKLKRYVAEMNLNMEERFSLCNESIIEIDISPLIENPDRFQEFLVFLRSVEPGNAIEKDTYDNKRIGKKVISNNTETKNDLHQVEYSSLFNGCKGTENLISNAHIDTKNKKPNMLLKQVDSEKCKEQIIEKSFKPLKNGGIRGSTQQNIHEKNKSNIKTQVESYEHEIENYALDFEDSTANNVNRNLNNTLIIRKKQQFPKINPVDSCDKKTRINLTYAEPKLNVQNETNTNHPSEIMNNNDNQNVFYAHRDIIDHVSKYQTSPQAKNISCKCLLHDNRVDYIRYKNQCLFGKGDESSNRFLRYAIHNNETYEANATANEKGAEWSNICTEDMDHVNDDYPSVTKLVCNDKENRANTQIVHSKCIKNNSNNNEAKGFLSFDKSHKYEKERSKNLHKNTIHSHPSQNELVNDGIYFERNATINNKNSSIECSRLAIDDVEKLVGAVSLSDHTVTSDYLTNSIVHNSNNNLVVTQDDDDNSNKQDEFNACFESLDYSINSISVNNEGAASLNMSISRSNMPKLNNTSSKFTYNNNNISESSRHSNENNKVTSTFKENQSSKLAKKSNDYDEKQNYYNYERIPYKYCSGYSNNSGQSQENASASTSKNNKTKKIKVSQNQIQQLIKNTNEVEKDITLLNECLSQLNTNQEVMDCSQENEYTLNEDKSYKPNKTNLLISINSGETHQISEATQTSSNKKHLKLNSLKPKNIYRSISSIFKGNRTKYKEVGRSMNKKTSSLDCYKSISRGRSQVGTSVAYNENGVKRCETPQSSNASEDEAQLFYKCLEKIYEQLERQQREIKEMKQVLNKRKK